MKFSLPQIFKRKKSAAIKRINTFKLSLYSTLLIAAAVGLLYIVGTFNAIEARSLDFRLKVRGPIPVNTAVHVVGIDDVSLSAFGRWPWPRSYQANLIDILTPYGPRAVVYDMLFTEPTEDKPDEDAAFAASLMNNRRTILGAFFRPIKEKDTAKKTVVPPALEKPLERFAICPITKSAGSWYRGDNPTLSIPALEPVILGSGFVNVTADQDGKLRRLPLLINYNGKFYPSLSLRAVMAYWGLEKKDITVKPGQWIELRLSEKERLRVPVDRRGFTYINYAGTIRAFEPLSFAKLMVAFYGEKGAQNLDLFKQFKDAIVLIGVTATATTDLISTPYIGLEPGVSMQASMVNSLLQKKFIWPSPIGVSLALFFFFAILIALLIPRFSPAIAFLIFAALSVLYPTLAWGLFVLFGWWLPVIAPLGIIALSYVAVVLIQFIGVRLDKQILEQELSIAQKIQRSFLPRRLPEVPGVFFAADIVMAKEVGGDLFDFLTFEDGSVGVTIGDVSGKGVPAALYMAKTMGDFRTHGRVEKTPAKTITKLNLTLIQEGASGMFVTLFYLVLSGDRKSLIFSSAGHHPLLKWSRKTGEITEHNTLKGKPLGIVPFKNLDEGTLAVEEGDILLLYTDGYDEAMNKARQTFGKKRIIETLKKNSKKSPAEIIQAFQESVKIFAGTAPQHDDMTLIAIRIGSSAQL